MRKGALLIATLFSMAAVAQAQSVSTPAHGSLPAAQAKPDFMLTQPSPVPTASGVLGKSVAYCESTFSCSDTGQPINCTGLSSCSAGDYWVTCDGTRHSCTPVCTSTCICGEYSCTGYSSCDDGLNWIQCDGHRHSCTPLRYC
jgi:hypothetical protein